jgi:hypothetical protein
VTLRVVGQPDEGTAAKLRDWSARAEAGEFVGFFGVATLPSGETVTCVAGMATLADAMLAVERVKLRQLLKELVAAGEIELG